MTPENVNFQSQKQSAVAATKDTANATTKREQLITENDKFDRMMEMGDSFEHEAAAARLINRSTDELRNHLLLTGLISHIV